MSDIGQYTWVRNSYDFWLSRCSRRCNNIRQRTPCKILVALRDKSKPYLSNQDPMFPLFQFHSCFSISEKVGIRVFNDASWTYAYLCISATIFFTEFDVVYRLLYSDENCSSTDCGPQWFTSILLVRESLAKYLFFHFSFRSRHIPCVCTDTQFKQLPFHSLLSYSGG